MLRNDPTLRCRDLQLKSEPETNKVLRLTACVSGFDILFSALLVYAVVRILAVVRKQSLQNSAMESLRKEETGALTTGSSPWKT